MMIRDLKAFLVLAEQLNFSASADALHLSPSTLSRVIQRLEENLGCPLFVRDNRNVALTDSGQLFVNYAQEAVARWEALRLQLGQHNSVSGQLSIYCTLTAAHLFLNPIIEKFRRAYPKVALHLETGDVALALNKIAQRESDVAFAVHSEQMSKKFQFHAVGKIPLAVIAPRIHCPFSERLQQSTIPWRTIPFIMPESGPAKRLTQKWCQSMGFSPNVYATVAGHEAIVSMVALGCGIALAPIPVIEHSPVAEKITVLDTGITPPAFNLGVVHLRQRVDEPPIAAFLKAIAASFSPRY
ncbi:MAG: HTH-type transcriptional activator IlvY [Gammaproteobacteria bacterium]|nr:HTH-type transcriptional activator IlvY [Gammaproteobacteria bacterium]